jgi:transcriptional regulator with XRE-family HTH domain
VETYDHKLLGERVRRARMALGWNQKYLADVTGIPQGNISRLERGKIQDIHLSRFVTLMRTLRVSADYLLGLESDMERETEDV